MIFADQYSLKICRKSIEIAVFSGDFFLFPRTRLKGNEEKTEAVEKTSDGERTPENATYM